MKVKTGNRFSDYIKLGAGFYIGYTIAKEIDNSLGSLIKPVIERIKERV